MIDTPITASSATLDRVLNHPQPKLLVLYSGGLPSELEQKMKQLAKDTAQKLLIVKIDTDENRDLKARYGLDRAITLLAMQGTQEVARSQQPTPAQIEQYADYLTGKIAQLPTEQPRPAPKAGGNGKPINVTDATFQQEVMQSHLPVLVDFWAVWCGPCRMVAPTLEKLAREFDGQIKIAKVNVDESQMVANQYQIRSIPTLYLFKNGKVVDQIVGAAPEPMLRQFVQKHV